VAERDSARLASALRSQRKAGKDLARLAASAARDGAAAGSSSRPSRLGLGSAAEVEVAGLLAEAAAATAAASAALFGTVAAMSASASAAACSCKRTAALMCLTKKVSEEEKETVALVERLEELEECIDGLEAGSDKVFRSLVQTRVALLNIHTHIF
jgi:phage-related protein